MVPCLVQRVGVVSDVSNESIELPNKLVEITLTANTQKVKKGRQSN